MKEKLKAHKRGILLCITILLALTLPAFFRFAVNQMQVYDPYRDFVSTHRAYGLTTQVLCPEILRMKMSENGRHKSRGLTGNMQEFSVTKWSSNGQYTYWIDGSLAYTVDGIRLEYKDDVDLKIPQSIRKQSFYTDSPAIQPPEDDGYCYFYFGFSEPMELSVLYQALRPLTEDPAFAEREIGVSWIPIETSSYPQDIALGIRGNLPAREAHIDAQFPVLLKSYADGESDADISWFTASLLWLATNGEHANVALSSGIYGEDVFVDYQKRLEYLYQHGCKALGIVIYADNRVLSYPGFENFRLIHCHKDTLVERLEPFEQYYDDAA
ncbi:MAG: hypothetical protein HFE85_02170 [Clostridiales bacterium]|nr:hypothetical protein [Clostridiales bacterium]